MMTRTVSKSSAGFFQRNLSLPVYLLLALSIGCSSNSSDGKYGVSGRVTLDGQSLDAGTISFVHEQKQGRPAATMFTNGTYSIPAEKGLMPGKYIARIYSEEVSMQPGGAPATNASDSTTNDMIGNTKPAVQRIPSEYNTRSTQMVEVTAEGSNEFDFFIKTN